MRCAIRPMSAIRTSPGRSTPLDKRVAKAALQSGLRIADLPEAPRLEIRGNGQELYMHPGVGADKGEQLIWKIGKPDIARAFVQKLRRPRHED